MKKTLTWIFIIAFMAVCFLPMAASIMGYEAENRENRPLAREPQLITRGGVNLDFPTDADDWWADHFGLREELVTAFHGLTMAVFQDTLNEKVVVGRKGWLFYEETMGDYLGTNIMSAEDIEKAARVLELMSRKCAELGMGFTFMSVPNKNTVYPEMMHLRFAPTYESRNHELLYDALAAEGVDTVDINSALYRRKSDGQLYYDEDTHWTSMGAAVGSMYVLAAAGIPCPNYMDMTPAEHYDYGGDLHNFVLPAAEGKKLRYDYGIPVSWAVDEGANPDRDATFGTVNGAGQGRLLLFRDSFGDAMVEFVSSNAARAVYSREFPYNLAKPLEGETFDHVAVELVERNIKNLVTEAPLMEAVEVTGIMGRAPETQVIRSRERGGYTQLYGAYDGVFTGHVYVKLTLGDGMEKTYEAFPVTDGDCADAGAHMAHPTGFVLTLPRGLEYGDAVVTIS